MTCEIIVMNRHAVALAADSAVTVTQWVNNKEEKRYFKGVNKVFQISKNQPVAMMVYGSGDLQQAPWELLAKEYRSHLGDKSFPTLAEYAADLFNFIKDAKDIFPDSYIENVFQTDCMKAAFRFFVGTLSEDEGYKAANTVEEKIAFSTNYLNQTIVNLDGIEFLPGFNQTDLDSALTAHVANFKQKIDGFNFPVDSQKLSEFSIKAIYKRQFLMGESGVVIAGFGSKEFYPSFKQYKCYGRIMNKLAYNLEEEVAINYHNNSSINGFATTQMLDTFLFGISPQSFEDSAIGCSESLRSIAQKLGQENHAELDLFINDETEIFRKKLISKSGDKNHAPLTRVVAALPVDEMAELAETLVSLESLKEKVTKPTESVGGPVDVAVITRGEGLVWIKRKHYFNPELNPRYFNRQTK